MKYKNIRVEEINPVVYLGNEFVDKDWSYNEKIFRKKIKNLKFKEGFEFECPIDDLIIIQLNHEDNFEDSIKIDTLDKIFNVTSELSQVFKNVKINLHLVEFLEEGNSIDLTVGEFVSWLREEIKTYKTNTK